MHAILDGIHRDQMTARHKANHIQIVYAPSKAEAYRGYQIKAAALADIGVEVHFCGGIASQS